MLLEPQCTGSNTSSRHPLCRFLLRLSRIKSFQVMFMVKFSPTALNFGYDFVLWVHFLGHPVYKEDNEGGWFHCERCCMSLLCRLICPLIHRCSSTSSVLTCPPPKDPLHTSCPAPPAPRRRPPASCPSFSNHPPSPPLSFVRRDLLYIFRPFSWLSLSLLISLPWLSDVKVSVFTPGILNLRRLFIFCAGRCSAL